VPPGDFADFDFVLGMDNGHLRQFRQFRRMKPAPAEADVALAFPQDRRQKRR
jgi:hypothetical protein